LKRFQLDLIQITECSGKALSDTGTEENNLVPMEFRIFFN